MKSCSLTAQLLFAELGMCLYAKGVGKTSSETFPVSLNLIKNACRGSARKTRASLSIDSFWPMFELILQSYAGFMVSSLEKKGTLNVRKAADLSCSFSGSAAFATKILFLHAELKIHVLVRLEP